MVGGHTGVAPGTEHLGTKKSDSGRRRSAGESPNPCAERQTPSTKDCTLSGSLHIKSCDSRKNESSGGEVQRITALRGEGQGRAWAGPRGSVWSDRNVLSQDGCGLSKVTLQSHGFHWMESQSEGEAVNKHCMMGVLACLRGRRPGSATYFE